MIHLFSSLLVLISAYQQLLEPFVAHSFTSSSLPLTYYPSSDALCSVSYQTSGTLTAWVRFAALPTSSQEFFFVQGSGKNNVKASMGIDGSVQVEVNTLCAGVVITLSSLPTLVWLHIGVSIQPSWQLIASVIGWNGVQTSQTKPILPYVMYDSSVSFIALGGRAPVSNSDMADARFYENALSLSDIANDAAVGTCQSGCLFCSGPLCIYYTLIGKNTAKTVNAISEPISLGLTQDHTSYAFTGWFYFTETDAGYRTLFRLTLTSNNCCNIGDRVMVILLVKDTNSLQFPYDTPTATNSYLPNLSLPVTLTQVGYQNKWVYVATSLSNGWNTNCYGLFSDTSLTCVTGATAAGGNLAWGVTATSRLYLGDPYHFSIIGKEADARMFFQPWTEAQFNSMFQQRKLTCVDNCSNCSDLMACTSCINGFYLSGGQCLRCSSCCQTCTGVSTNCIVCASTCSQSPPICTRTLSFRLSSFLPNVHLQQSLELPSLRLRVLPPALHCRALSVHLSQRLFPFRSCLCW